MNDLRDYLFDRMEGIEKMMERGGLSDSKFHSLAAKYDAFAEIEDYLTGNLEDFE